MTTLKIALGSKIIAIFDFFITSQIFNIKDLKLGMYMNSNITQKFVLEKNYIFIFDPLISQF